MSLSVIVLKIPKMESTYTKLIERDFIYRFVNGQKLFPLPVIFEKEKFKEFSIEFARVPVSSDFLTSTEIIDVEESWKQIDDGKAKKFRSVEEFLEELKI